MSARDSGPRETWPVAQSSAMAQTTDALVMGPLVGQYGYATLSADGIDVCVFPDRESLRRGLARVYTRTDRWGFPASWQNVLVFAPDDPPRLRMVIEEDDAEGGDS
jgi:hypothetical protein